MIHMAGAQASPVELIPVTVHLARKDIMTAPEQAPEKTSLERAQEFVTSVARICEEPGKRAALRSGLGRPLDRSPRMHQVLAARVPEAAETTERAYYAVAAMIASLPPKARISARPAPGNDAETSADTDGRVVGRNFGQCLAEGVALGGLRESFAESRLNLLTRQSVDGLHRHLPAVVRVLAAKPSSVDWAQLLLDLRNWDGYRDEITRRWLQSFYRTRFKDDKDARERADRDNDTPPASH